MQHAAEISHSEFLVLLSVPGGAAATSNYLRRLWEFPEPFVADPMLIGGERRTQLNPGLPQIPSGTRVALARRMLLVDSTGRIRTTRIAESVQLRVFKDPSQPDARAFHGDQDFLEFRMRRRGLFASESGGLHAVAPDEAGPLTFSSQGIDQFERPESASRRVGSPILSGCVNCHAERASDRSESPRVCSSRVPCSTTGPPPGWRTWATPAPEAKARRFDWGC